MSEGNLAPKGSRLGQEVGGDSLVPSHEEEEAEPIEERIELPETMSAPPAERDVVGKPRLVPEWDFGVVHPLGEGFRCGYVALAGRPNVGKSTLLNVLLGDKVSIVSPKPQTTRRRVVGILTTDTFQAVFLDTPGIHRPRLKAGEAMVKQARDAIQEADVVLCVVDACVPPTPEDRMMITAATELAPRAPRLLVPNKIDLLQHQGLTEQVALYAELSAFDQVIPVSALYATYTDRLLLGISAHLPVSPPLYPEDVISPDRERDTGADIIREAVLHRLYEEVPHSVAVEIEEWKERANGVVYVRATIYVEKASQKRIVIGAGGSTLRQIGVLARQQLQTMMDRPVYLDLWVKVWKNWRKNEQALRQLGLWKR